MEGRPMRVDKRSSKTVERKARSDVHINIRVSTDSIRCTLWWGETTQGVGPEKKTVV